MGKQTLERHAYVDGLFDELAHQVTHHHDLVRRWGEVMGQLEVSERAVRLSRDHLYDAMSRYPGEEVPQGWKKVLDTIRFVGMRTADACIQVLKERGNLSTDDLLGALNDGGFRFNSPYPIRELNAAMLRHPHVKRDGDCWVYSPPPTKPKVVKDKAVSAA